MLNPLVYTGGYPGNARPVQSANGRAIVYNVDERLATIPSGRRVTTIALIILSTFIIAGFGGGIYYYFKLRNARDDAAAYQVVSGAQTPTENQGIQMAASRMPDFGSTGLSPEASRKPVSLV